MRDEGKFARGLGPVLQHAKTYLLKAGRTYEAVIAAELQQKPWLAPDEAEALAVARLRYRRLGAYHRRCQRGQAPRKRKGGRI